MKTNKETIMEMLFENYCGGADHTCIVELEGRREDALSSLEEKIKHKTAETEDILDFQYVVMRAAFYGGFKTAKELLK